MDDPSSIRNVRAGIAETLLASISHERPLASGGTSAKEPLKVLRREFPDLEALVAGKTVLDFGCGHGDQSAALVTTYRCRVTGLDNNPRVLDTARRKNGDQVRFIGEPDGARYDVVISQNAMEHFSDPAGVLATMRQLVADDGVVLITFGPPWFAPYGSHMHFFCKMPWLNILFPDRAVMAVRARYRSDGAQRYEEVEGGLNRMTLEKFERLVAASGFLVVWKRYTALKKLNFLTRIPLLRELVTVHVTAVLRPPRD